MHSKKPYQYKIQRGIWCSSETQDPATDYYENVLDESKAENETNTEGPLYESVTESGEGKDVYSEQLLGTRFDMCTYFILPHCT